VLSADDLSEDLLYRRVPASDFDKKSQRPRPTAFTLRDHESHLSMFVASLASPRKVLEQVIRSKELDVVNLENKDSINDEEERKLRRTKKWLENNLNASAVCQDYYVVEIPVKELLSFRNDYGEPPFSLGEITQDTGHIDILGSREAFENNQDNFVNLVITGKARVLSKDECLANL